MAGESPPNEGVGMAMTHAVIGFEKGNYFHVLLFSARQDNFLPFED